MKSSFGTVVLSGLAVLLLSGCGGMGGGYSDNSVNMPAPTGDSGMAAEALRVGDVLDIRLSGVPLEAGNAGVSQEKINESGTITMPYLSQPFQAVGLSPTQLKLQIEQAYRDQKIFSTPNVTIIAQPRFINVNGEVRAPQRVQFTNDLTVLGAVSACGGFTDYADRGNISILRNKKIIRFNAKEAQRNPAMDLSLLPGDQIEVKRTIF
jgi:polysaccharide export outer membrane protein